MDSDRSTSHMNLNKEVCPYVAQQSQNMLTSPDYEMLMDLWSNINAMISTHLSLVTALLVFYMDLKRAVTRQ